MYKKLTSPDHLEEMSGATLNIFLTKSASARGMMSGTSSTRKPLSGRGKVTQPTLDPLGSTVEYSSSWYYSVRKSCSKKNQNTPHRIIRETNRLG